MKTEGLSTHRLNENPTEAQFAKVWAEWNRGDRNTLALILDPNHGCRGCSPDPADRDAVVAATVVQWLGSPVGRYFLEEAGFVRT